MSAIVDFFHAKGTDGAGRLVGEVWELSLDEKESVHDYIQWLFPLQEASQFNPDAPLLTADDVALIPGSYVLYGYRKMLAFYGLQEVYYPGRTFVIKLEIDELGEEGVELVERMAGTAMVNAMLGREIETLFERRKQVWLTPGNHNFLRITRILKCLNLFGLHEQADAFLDTLEEIHQEHADIIGQKTYDFWVSASTKIPFGGLVR